jgi:hypothetical protein
MQAVVRTALLVGLTCACSGGAPAVPEGTLPTDSSTSAGLHVPWSTSPAIPRSAGGDVTIQSAVFRIDSLRVIGDAGPGDPRTSEFFFETKWSASNQPDTIDFSDAPTGLYSQVTVQIDGHLVDYSYEITGTAVVSGETKNFEIHDRNALTANINISTMLDPGGQAIVPIRVRFDDALGVVDFSTLRTDDGVLQLDTFDAQMPAFRDKLTTSIQLGDGGTH